MRKHILTALVVAGFCMATPLYGQQVCPGFSIVVNTPEDELTLAYNGAENPQDQVAALDKFMAAHADSKFVPCAHEYYTMAYLKLNDYAKVIEHGEQGLAAHPDLMLTLNVAKAYVASGKTSDAVFDAILKAPELIKTESTSSRPPNVSDDDWKKETDAGAEQAKDWRAYMEYAFFQLLQREPDGSKRAQRLDQFVQSYPDSPNQGQINFNYYLAYKIANNPAKADEYGEKAIASAPDDVVTLNLVADDYATRQTSLDKAETYAKKAVELAGAMKKPEGLTPEQFKANQDSQAGLAHMTLGYVAFQKGSKAHKVAPAIEEFKKAVELLPSNPQLQGRALFYLGYAYEVLYPPSHKGAIDALTRSVGIASPWQAQAQDLLGKVKKAAGQ